VALLPGEVIEGKYRVVRLLGEGGMGAVYEGENLRIGRPVAIKVMHASLTLESDLVERFEREAHAAAQVASRHVVDVLDLGDLPDGDRYMVMELLRGESLSTRLKARERLAPHEIALLSLQLLDGLAKIHDAGIIHRDLKPANVFLVRMDDGSDFVKLLDFGICKFMDRKETTTAVGHCLGTPAYMAPELLGEGVRNVDARCDVYSVGVILYRCAAGRLPFVSKDIVDLLLQMKSQKPPRLREVAPEVDTKLAAIVDIATAPKPSARFRDARELKHALADWARGIDRVDRLLAEFLEIERASTPRYPSPFEAITRPYPVLSEELLEEEDTLDALPGPRESLAELAFGADEPDTSPR
jgi:serine/threonine-protein kinase